MAGTSNFKAIGQYYLFRSQTLQACNCTSLATMEGDILYDWSEQAICERSMEMSYCMAGMLASAESPEDAFYAPDCRLECDYTKYQVRT